MRTIADGTYALIGNELTKIFPTEGFIVADKGGEVIIPSGSSHLALELVFDSFRTRSIAGDVSLVGVWTDDDGCIYVDSVRAYDDYNVAIKAGRDNDQIAIWDCYRHEAIKCTQPYIVEYKGHRGISSFSANSALDLAKGSWAKANQQTL